MARYYKFIANNEIEKILDSVISKPGPFNDEQEFIDHLIKNYNAESKFLLAGKEDTIEIGRQPIGVLDAGARNELKKLVKEIENTFDKERLDKIGNLNTSDIYGVHHANLIYNWQNRILPIKFILAIFATLIITRGTARITLDDLKDAVISEVDEFGKRIGSKAHGKAFKVIKGILIGFPMSYVLPPWKNSKHYQVPTPTQVLRSRRRFLEQFLGRKTISKDVYNLGFGKREEPERLGIYHPVGMAGACFEMGLLQAFVKNGSNDIFIIPTGAGLDFMCMTNPILEYIYDKVKLPEKIFAEKERKLFMEIILPRFELEKEIVDEFFKLEEGTTEVLQEIFNKKQKIAFEKFWKNKAWDDWKIRIISFTYKKNSDKKFFTTHDRYSTKPKGMMTQRYLQRWYAPDDWEDVIIGIEGELTVESEWLQDMISEYWARIKIHQRAHLVVMLSRLVELGYCSKSLRKPIIYSFTVVKLSD